MKHHGKAMSTTTPRGAAVRVCKTCQIEKPADGFPKNKLGGIHGRKCNACCAAWHRDRRAAGYTYVAKDPERRLRKIREARKVRNVTEPGWSYEVAKRIAAKNPELFKAIKAVYRRLTRNPKLRQAVFERDGRRCLCCMATSDLVIDHIVPVLSGGTNDPNNLQTLCRPCNSRKRGIVNYRKDAG
jgi:5-methylcytosine-specific restriction endonuclease McrA